MTTTTVRIRGSTKNRLRRLQEAWRKVRGDRPPQQELLEVGLEYIDRHFDAFIAESTWRPLSPQELRKLRRLQGRYGNWSVKDLDEIVYGESP